MGTWGWKMNPNFLQNDENIKYANQTILELSQNFSFEKENFKATFDLCEAN